MEEDDSRVLEETHSYTSDVQIPGLVIRDSGKNEFLDHIEMLEGDDHNDRKKYTPAR